MTNNTGEVSGELISSFRRLHKILHKSVYRSLGQELKPSPFLVMIHLLRSSKTNPEGRRVSDIAETVGMSVAAVTQILNGLEKRELIQREMDPGDRRAVQVRLTDSGAALMEPAFRHLSEIFEGLTAYLGEESGRTLVTLLSRVEEYFSDGAVHV